MPDGHNFQHLPLILRYAGPAKLFGGSAEAQATINNRQNRQSHSSGLRTSGTSIISAWQSRQAERTQQNMPALPAGIPVLLEVDPSLDLDKLRHFFDFEIVSEEEEGFVIVAAADINLTRFLQLVNDFASEVHGSATIASVHRLFDEPGQTERLRRILSDRMFQQWPTLEGSKLFLVDIGVTCLGTREIPSRPKRGKRDSDGDWARKEQEWATARSDAYREWDDVKAARENEIEQIIVNGYGGEILKIVDGAGYEAAELPDSFTIRVKVSGKGLRDFVLNFPYIFEVVEPDDVELPQYAGEAGEGEYPIAGLQPPAVDAPAVCVIDSGLQEQHVLLEPAVDKPTSFCFLQGRQTDALCQEYDVLVVQSSGNLRVDASPPSCGVRDHFAAGRDYPEYLAERSSRIADPAQSLQALTVGSIAYGLYDGTGWRTLASESGQPSGFTRTGLGIWDVIKPEVVELGGDYLRTPGSSPSVSTPAAGRDCYPELVRSTMFGPGPLYDRDEVGTSFAAPKVTHIAARLQQLLPDEPCLLYRALIVQSARWPTWARTTEDLDATKALRYLGYGIPDLQRATTNTDHRTTFITSGETDITAGDCHIFQVPIPESLRQPADEYDILVEVTLSYVAQPRRTRRNLRRYLSTWVDWKSSRLGESIDSFRRRALKDQEEGEAAAGGVTLRWTLGTRTDWGAIEGVRRTAGTVQKDWATVKSNSLPESFCIAVVGHQGWSKDPDSSARYAIAVSFEILGQEIPIYDALRTAVEELQSELEAEEQVETELEAEDS